MKKLTYLFTIALLCHMSYGQDKKVGLYFDGDDDHVVIPDHDDLDLGRSAFTIEAWIQADTGNKSTLAPIVLSKKGVNSSSNDGFLFGLTDKGYIALQIEGTSIGPGFGGSGVSAVDLRDGTCHHIAWTREVGGTEDTVNGYQDAALVRGTRKPAGLKDMNSTENLTIGWSEFPSTANTYEFEGIIKEVRIWDFAKTESQIFNDKNKHLTGNETGLVAYWRLNENFGDSVYDCAAGDHRGVIKNGAAWMNGCDVLNAIPSSCVPDTSGPIDTGTFVLSHEKEFGVELFPNPAREHVVLKFNKQLAQAQINLTDLSGRLIKSWVISDASEYKVNLDAEAGIYILQVHSTEFGTLSRRILIE